MNTQCAGLIFDESSHYLDHLAPFCALMRWQLMVCEESVASRALSTILPDDHCDSYRFF